MTHPTDDSLKPCPFCGGAASLHPRTCDKNTPYNPADRAFPVARCGQCGAEAPGKDWGRPETAAEKWNARALLAAQPAVQQPAEDAGLLDRHGKIRGDLKASAYCVGNEYKPFHPSASHVRPEWRDGWNACFVAAIKAQGGKQ